MNEPTEIEKSGQKESIDTTPLERRRGVSIQTVNDVETVRSDQSHVDFQILGRGLLKTGEHRQLIRIDRSRWNLIIANEMNLRFLHTSKSRRAES